MHGSQQVLIFQHTDALLFPNTRIGGNTQCRTFEVHLQVPLAIQHSGVELLEAACESATTRMFLFPEVDNSSNSAAFPSCWTPKCLMQPCTGKAGFRATALEALESRCGCPAPYHM